MQITLWSRDRLESLVKDLIEENKRLHRINWGRMIGVIFFVSWTAMVCLYFFPTANVSPLKCSVKTPQSSK